MSAFDNTGLPTPVLILDPKTIIGPMFIGNILNWMFMGILVVQVYIFYLNFVRDSIWIKVLVYGVFALDILQTVLGTHQVWWYSISHWNNFESLLSSPPWTTATIPMMCGLVSAVVQIFYAQRIWRLKNTWVIRGISVLIVLIAVSQGLASIISSSLLERDLSQQNLLRLHPGFDISLAGSFVADILIAGSMIWILHNSKSRTSWGHSQTLINRLITNVIQTGTPVVLCAGLDLVLFVKLADANYHFVPGYILGKLYSNSLMVSLNARRPSETPSSQKSGGGNLEMRVHVSRETQRTAHFEREGEHWPVVKMANNGINTSQHTVEGDTDVDERQTQVLVLENPRTGADMA